MRKTRKLVILVIALILLAFGFRVFVILVDSILSVHNIHWKIRMIGENFIDFYGAIVPTLFSLFIVFCVVSLRKFPFRNYVSHFLLSIAFGLVTSRPTPNAVVTFYVLFAFLVSSLAVIITFYNPGFVKLLRFRDFHRFDFSRGNYFNALLIAYSYATFSILIVDLAYLPFAISFYIGAGGLIDGIMLSGLITPLCVSLVTLFVLFLHEMHK